MRETSRGRPRDASKDAVVLQTVRRLLAEGGYQAATIPAVARASGVGAPTIYRRWARQPDLVESALQYAGATVGDSGPTAFSAYLEEFVTAVVTYFADPATRAAVPGLLVEYHGDPGRYDRLVARAEDPIRQRFAAAHAAAVTLGEVSPSPSAAALFDSVVGTAVYHGVWKQTADRRLVRQILDVTLAATRPHPETP